MTDVKLSLPVSAQDRVSDVLARDEALVEVFVRCAPHFSKLRNRAMRRVMARLVTVEQAARTANVPVARLVHDLNAALGIVIDPAKVAATAPSPDAEDNASPAHPASARIVELDVREDLRSGREPFSRILGVVSELCDDDVLHLRAIFEPVPLFTVLGKRGFVHESRSNAPDDWSVWFWRPAPSADASAGPIDAARDAPAAAPVATPTDDKTTWLDVRGLDPPEPLLRTLGALETLPPDHVLVQVNSRVPQLLFPMLVERGFACDVDDSQADQVLVRIWHAR